MRIFFDTEFIEDGRTIDLISIGMVDKNGVAYYAENADCDLERASPWVKENVFPKLQSCARIPLLQIRRDIEMFAGPHPEFWAYYGAYDWVALCQLFGKMIDLPKGWPYYCRDVKQLCDSMGNPKLPPQTTPEHHALNDALWTKQAYEFLTTPPPRLPM